MSELQKDIWGISLSWYVRFCPSMSRPSVNVHFVGVCGSPICPIYAHIGAYVCHDHVRFAAIAPVYSGKTDISASLCGICPFCTRTSQITKGQSGHMGIYGHNPGRILSGYIRHIGHIRHMGTNGGVLHWKGTKGPNRTVRTNRE